MTKLKEYTNGGFELNEPDYILNCINFVGTCSACPEQYDCYIVDTEGKKLQVGYVRLRWGNLSCAFPDVGGELVYGHSFGDGFKGCFDNETERLDYLEIISINIRSKLINIGVINDTTN